MRNGDEAYTAITIGTHNVQVIVNIHVTESEIEKWLKMIGNSYPVLKVEAYEEIPLKWPTGSQQAQTYLGEPSGEQQPVAERSGLVIRGMVEPTL